MSGDKLAAVQIRKEYPGTVALDNVSLGFSGGKIHALIGKNGAGKSTLVKIFSGAVRPTSGRVAVDGREIRLRSPADAFRQGIATVYQELSLVPELTVGENILFGRLPRRNLPGGLLIDWPGVFRSAESLLERIGVNLDVRQKVGRLGIAQQQVVEIAKAMSFEPSVLMLDEPTSALARHEVGLLFELIRRLAARGVCVIYISHRLQELPQIADTVSVLRDGSYVGRMDISEATPQQIGRMMFGRGSSTTKPVRHSKEESSKEAVAPSDAAPRPILEVRNLTRRGQFEDVSFQLHAGEILGIAGMLGSGRTELLTAIFGAQPFDEGRILIDGQTVSRHTPRNMKRLGLGLAPEDRKRQALVQRMSVRDNLCLASLSQIARRGLITRAMQLPLVRRLIEQLRIRLPSIDRAVSTLSGGNQQKVVLGQWLASRPRVMLLDEPTRGIDVEAKRQVFEIIRDLSRRGIASIMVSSELEELVEVCHRILVLRKGRIVGQYAANQIDAERLFEACLEE
jgi:ribose transport system ATP-binding protein